MTDNAAPVPSERRRVRVLEVGGSHVTAAIVEVDPSAGTARVVERVDTPLDPHAPAGPLLDALAAPLSRLHAAQTVGAATAAAAAATGPDSTPTLVDDLIVALPGPFDDEAGTGQFGEVAKFAALTGIDVRAGLAARLSLAPARVSFVNDAVAYAIGEWAFGDAGRVDRLVCITLGTGVGSAFLDRGEPVDDGPSVPSGGYVYRLLIDDAPLEETVSTRALVAAYSARSGRRLSVEQIAAAARDGDGTAAGVLTEAFSALGSALAPWLRSFDAAALVVGGSMSRSWDLVAPALLAGIGPDGPPVRPSRLLDSAPLLGAAHHLIRRLTRETP